MKKEVGIHFFLLIIAYYDRMYCCWWYEVRTHDVCCKDAYQVANDKYHFNGVVSLEGKKFNVEIISHDIFNNNNNNDNNDDQSKCTSTKKIRSKKNR